MEELEDFFSSKGDADITTRQKDATKDYRKATIESYVNKATRKFTILFPHTRYVKVIQFLELMRDEDKLTDYSAVIDQMILEEQKRRGWTKKFLDDKFADKMTVKFENIETGDDGSEY